MESFKGRCSGAAQYNHIQLVCMVPTNKDHSWKMTVVYCKLSQMIATIAATHTMKFLLEQINAGFGT